MINQIYHYLIIEIGEDATNSIIGDLIFEYKNLLLNRVDNEEGEKVIPFNEDEILVLITFYYLESFYLVALEESKDNDDLKSYVSKKIEKIRELLTHWKIKAQPIEKEFIEKFLEGKAKKKKSKSHIVNNIEKLVK